MYTVLACSVFKELKISCFPMFRRVCNYTQNGFQCQAPICIILKIMHFIFYMAKTKRLRQFDQGHSLPVYQQVLRRPKGRSFEGIHDKITNDINAVRLVADGLFIEHFRDFYDERGRIQGIIPAPGAF